jgi:hypothetical protein
MPPTWLTILAAVSSAVALACAVAIVADIVLAGHRQRMWIMEVVWPVTALYTGPIGLWAYRRYGRGGDYGRVVSTGIGVSHCGSGCTLGDIIAAFVVFAAGWTLFGLALYAEMLVGFAFAFLLGVLFQYFSIAPMRGLGVRDGIVTAMKVDALSLISFEVGLFAWMALTQLVLFPEHLSPDQPAYWLMMQIGMMLGFATAYPVNWWLIAIGVKEPM